MNFGMCAVAGPATIEWSGRESLAAEMADCAHCGGPLTEEQVRYTLAYHRQCARYRTCAAGGCNAPMSSGRVYCGDHRGSARLCACGDDISARGVDRCYACVRYTADRAFVTWAPVHAVDPKKDRVPSFAHMIAHAPKLWLKATDVAMVAAGSFHFKSFGELMAEIVLNRTDLVMQVESSLSQDEFATAVGAHDNLSAQALAFIAQASDAAQAAALPTCKARPGALAALAPERIRVVPNPAAANPQVHEHAAARAEFDTAAQVDAQRGMQAEAADLQAHGFGARGTTYRKRLAIAAADGTKLSFTVVGKTDGHDASGRIVETKNRRGHLRGIPPYERAQLEMYMYLSDTRSIVHVENAPGRSKVRVVETDPAVGAALAKAMKYIADTLAQRIGPDGLYLPLPS